MTDPPSEETPKVPTVFGVPMRLEGGPSWHLDNKAFWVSVYSRSGLSEWSVTALTTSGMAIPVGEPNRYPSPNEAAIAIESRLRSLVLSLVPLLDDETKGEVVKLCSPETVAWHTYEQKLAAKILEKAEK